MSVLIIKLCQSNLQLAGAEMKVVCFSPLKYGASVYNLSAFALIYFFILLGIIRFLTQS
jgi:hypothetical protein